MFHKGHAFNVKFLCFGLLASVLIIFLVILKSEPGVDERDFADPSLIPDILQNQSLIITVKTSAKTYSKRLKYVLDTWYNLAPEQIYVVTDGANPEMTNRIRERLGDHIIESKCGADYWSPSLACKAQMELEVFYRATPKWSCRFDDDNYVNIPKLREVLAEYNADEPVLLGRLTMPPLRKEFRGREFNVSFPTGNGMCMSWPLVFCMYELRWHGPSAKLASITKDIRSQDDIGFGFLVTEFCRTKITDEKRIHNHHEILSIYNRTNIAQQAVLAGTTYKDGRSNTVDLPADPYTDDPLRFHALHCHLFPQLCGQ